MSKHLTHKNIYELKTDFKIAKPRQRISSDGKIVVSKKAWIVRLSAIFTLVIIMGFNLYTSLKVSDPFIAYTTLMPLHAVLIMTAGWIYYRNPASKGKAGNELVSVLVPIFNQKDMIETVFDHIYDSTYKNIEVIAVNDGSTDGTKQILNKIKEKYPRLTVIHKKNEGKRRAIAQAFPKAKGKYIVLIDSDSVIDKKAIEEFMKAFNSDPKIGAVVGFTKAWNAYKTLTTKLQDVWYDYAFNIHKTCESAFGNVMCCSGSLAGYRRETISNFIPYWMQAKIHNSEDRDLTTYTIAKKWAKKDLAPYSTKLMESMADYDDSEDRALTAYSLVEWKTVYVASAITYTDVPETWTKWLRQQKRWKKGYLRSNFFVSAFFWQKNPLISIIFYTEFITTFTTPFIIFIVIIYIPFMTHNYVVTLSYLFGSLLLGVVQGADNKFRDPVAKYWTYKPLMNLIVAFVLAWLLFPALWNYKKNEWLTR